MTSYDLFKKYKNGCDIFFETGTHMGAAVQSAIDLNFNKILSVEIRKELYDMCTLKFKDNLNNKVFLFYGNSVDKMDEMLNMVDSKCLFWIDAHGSESQFPAYKELEKISQHAIKNHTIIIDDIPLYFNYIVLEIMLLTINKDYKVVLEDAILYHNGEFREK
jgi:hypothetical protein